MANPLMKIPGLGGYLAQEQMTNQANESNFQQASGMQSLLMKMQQQQELKRATDAISGSSTPEEGIGKLRQLGTPIAIKMASEIAQLSGLQMKAAAAAREQQFFSPENRQRFTNPGQPAQPGIPQGMDELGGGPGRPVQPAVAPTFDMERFAQEGVMSGVKGAEPLLNHLGQREQARAAMEATTATRNQTAAIQLMGLQARAREADQRSQDRALDRQARADAQAEARNLRREMANLAGSMRQPAAGVAVMGSDGKPVFVPRGQEIGKTPASSGAASDRQEQKGAMADYAETLVSRLETLLGTDPRSTTGMFSGPVRGVEAVTNAVVPGAIGSQATIAKQTKEQLISVLGQIRGGGQGRLSNQDMRRVDTAIGQLNTGTPEGMAQGLKDARELINTMKGGAAPATSGQTGMRASDQDLINKYLGPR